MKLIRVKSCSDCPYHGKCKSWKKLNSKQRTYLSISNSVPHDFMLKDCELEDDETANDNHILNREG